MADSVRFKDFSATAEPVRFQIDADVFEAPAVLPVPVMQELAKVAGKLKLDGEGAAVLDTFTEVFDAILTEESAARFRERLESRTRPVGLNQVVDIMMWLLEVYGLRPTQPLSDSSNGSPSEPSGIPSADGAPNAE